MDGNLQYAENGVKFKRLTERQKKCTATVNYLIKNGIRIQYYY